MSECNIVKDLMPLCIDGVASEESAKLVEEHIAGCEPCAKAYADLQGEIHAKAMAKEQAAFEKAAKEIRRRRSIRKALTMLLTALLCIVLMVGCGLWVNHLHETVIPLQPDEYDMRVVQVKGTDDVVYVLNGMRKVLGFGTNFEYDHAEKEIRWQFQTTKRQISFPGDWEYSDSFMQFTKGKVVDGQLVQMVGGEPYRVMEVTIAAGDAVRVIYQAGDPLTVSSDELAEYYLAWSEPFASDEKIQRLFALVPEFK